MGATAANLIAYVEDQIKRDDITSVVVDAINDAIIDIVLQVRPPESHDLQTITTSAGTDTYGLDSDLLAIQAVAVTNPAGSTKPNWIKRGGVWSWLLRGRGTQERGQPKKWLRRNNSIELYDLIPDNNGGSNYTVEVVYLKRPTTLSAASPATASDLNTEWDYPTKLLASAKMFLYLQDFDKAGAMFQQAGALIQGRRSPNDLEDLSDNDATVQMNAKTGA